MRYSMSSLSKKNLSTFIIWGAHPSIPPILAVHSSQAMKLKYLGVQSQACKYIFGFISKTIDLRKISATPLRSKMLKQLEPNLKLYSQFNIPRVICKNSFGGKFIFIGF